MSEENWKIDLGPIEVEKAQLELWRDGTLGKKWARRFKGELPQYFDADFDRFYRNQGMRHPPKFEGGLGFFETLAAIVLYDTTGYRPLGPTWNFEFCPEISGVVEKLLPADVIEVIKNQERFGGTQAPDLLMHAPNLSQPAPDWFFCEVKGVKSSGRKDKLSKKQEQKFEEIAEVSDRPVRVLHFKWAPRRP